MSEATVKTYSLQMAKADQEDCDAAYALMNIIDDLADGYFPAKAGDEDAPTFFDEDDPEHLRALYDCLKKTIDSAPGSIGRVVGGFCGVILYEKNGIVDPDSNVLELHPHLVEAQELRNSLSTAAADVLAERRRQIEAEGWTPEHDDEHDNGQMAVVASCYAVRAHEPERLKKITGPLNWPWDFAWWKPSTPRRDLVKAGALIIAELERLDRAAEREKARALDACPEEGGTE